MSVLGDVVQGTFTAIDTEIVGRFVVCNYRAIAYVSQPLAAL